MVADAWFLRGLEAMVGPKPADFLDHPEWRRIEFCLLAWFDTLAEHRRVSAQILARQAAPIAPASLGAYGVQSLACDPMAARGCAAAGCIRYSRQAQTGGGWTDGTVCWGATEWTGDETWAKNAPRDFLRSRTSPACLTDQPVGARVISFRCAAAAQRRPSPLKREGEALVMARP